MLRPAKSERQPVEGRRRLSANDEFVREAKDLGAKNNMLFGLPGVKSRKYQTSYYVNKLTGRMTDWSSIQRRLDRVFRVNLCHMNLFRISILTRHAMRSPTRESTNFVTKTLRQGYLIFPNPRRIFSGLKGVVLSLTPTAS